MRPKLWIPCKAPGGHTTRAGQPARAWQHKDGAILVEYPSNASLWRDDGEWIIIYRGRELAKRYHWYGRGLKNPPTTWANKQLAELPPANATAPSQTAET